MINYRTGIGYDVHKLIEGKKLILGGVHIPYSKGLLGHSDADVLIHAICDALLGALALGDIGIHFPDSDLQWKNISSLLLLEKVKGLLAENNYQISNIDSIIVMQEPKIAAFIFEMRNNLANTLKIDIDAVSVKATTTEGLGFEGRGEGISAQASCLIFKI